MEGVTYDHRNNTLLWVDIIVGEAHRIFLDDEDLEKRHQIIKLKEAGATLGAIIQTSEEDVVIIVHKRGASFANFNSGAIKPYVSWPIPEKELERLRGNDSNIDPWGNLWVGLMNDFPVMKSVGPQPEGYLFRIDHKTGEVKVMIENTNISNGMAFSDDGTKFYWTDSPTHQTYSFDYDNATATLSNRQPIINYEEVFKNNKEVKEVIVPGCMAIPDGLDFTADNHIILGIFSAGVAIEHDLKGEILKIYKFPAEQITCVAVGGRDGNEIFFTAAHREHEDDDAVIKVADENDTEFGGYLYRYKSETSLKPRNKRTWGGKVDL